MDDFTFITFDTIKHEALIQKEEELINVLYTARMAKECEFDKEQIEVKLYDVQQELYRMDRTYNSRLPKA
jgi:hypothetical protein